MSSEAPFHLSEHLSSWKYLKPFLVGGCSGVMATCIIQPIDQIKVQIQLAPATASRNPVVVASNFVRQNGCLALYNGLSAGILRQLTYGMSRLGLFRTMTNHFSENGTKKMDMMTTAGCSLVAGGLGALIGTPADVALIRMQADTTLPVDQRRGYRNGLQAMYRIAMEEGLKGFFSGATPTVIRGIALNIGMLASYDKLKELAAPHFGGATAQATLISASVGSGILGATFCLPFDFVKTRLQNMKPDAAGKVPYKGFVDCCSQVMRKEGFLKFYTGYPTFLLRIAPHIVLTWLFMEALNKAEFLK